MGRTSTGLWPPSRAPPAPRLGQGRRPAHPQVPGCTCGHAQTATAAARPLPGAPAHCGCCDTDTTLSGHRDKEQEDLTLTTLMPNISTERQSNPSPPACSYRSPSTTGEVKPMQGASLFPVPDRRLQNKQPQPLLVTALSHPSSYYLVLNTTVQGKHSW